MTDPTHPEVGASASRPLPEGYDHLHERERLGGPGTFDAARRALFSWAPQWRILSIYMASLNT